MDLGIKDKTILVTGGSKGIGRAICRAFLAEGARVGFCARNPDQIAATEAELDSLGTITGTSLDVSDSTAVADWVAAMAAKYGGIDSVVANASALSIGVATENWKSGYDIDLMGTQNLVNAATLALVEAAQRHGDASFTMITSTAAAEAPFANAYGAIKAAMIHLTKGLARQHAAQGVRFNSVSPGTVYSDGGHLGADRKGDARSLQADAGPQSDWAYGNAGGCGERCCLSFMSAVVIHHRHQHAHRRRPDPARELLKDIRPCSPFITMRSRPARKRFAWLSRRNRWCLNLTLLIL